MPKKGLFSIAISTNNQTNEGFELTSYNFDENTLNSEIKSLRALYGIADARSIDSSSVKY